MVRLFGPLFDEVGQYLADGFRQWRWRRDNFERVAERCEREKEAREIDENSLTAVSEGDAYRLADACSFEDNEMVQELWAGLITSAMEPEKEIVAMRAFIEILKAIGPAEAGLLLILSEVDRGPPRQPRSQEITSLNQEELRSLREDIYQTNKEWEERLKILADRVFQRFPENHKQIAIQNLFRLRCIGLRARGNLDLYKALLGVPHGVRDTDVPPTYEAFTEVTDYLEWLILVGAGTGNHKQAPFSSVSSPFSAIPEISFELTHLGRSLISSCMTNTLRQRVHDL